MKQFLSYLLLLTLLLLAAAGMDAKAQPPATKGEGFWVLETNVHTPKSAVVYFYSNQHVVVYKEAIEGVRLNPAKRKTIRHLNGVLQQALVAWHKNNVMQENKQMLASRLQ